jgi:hypothetical protein
MKNLIGRGSDIENIWLAELPARKNLMGRVSDIKNI